mgnify:CR=1 FL=1
MRSISSTELNLRDIRSLRYVDLKKVNFFVGHPVACLEVTEKFGVGWWGGSNLNPSYLELL